MPLLVAAALVAFASNSVLCRAALADGSIDPVTFTSIRLAAGTFALFLLARGRIKAGSWLSAIALAAYAFAFSVAYVDLPAGSGALILFAAVQVTMIGTGVARGQRPSALEWAGVAAAMAGLVALTQPWRQAPELAGAALMAGAGIAWGVYSLRGRSETDPLRANGGNFARSLLFVVPAMALQSGVRSASLRGVALAAISGAIASGCGYAAWYAVLPRLSRVRAAVLQLAVAPLAALGGVVFLGEQLGLRLIACGLVIVGGIAVAIMARR